jgi:hypothetical protein
MASAIPPAAAPLPKAPACPVGAAAPTFVAFFEAPNRIVASGADHQHLGALGATCRAQQAKEEAPAARRGERQGEGRHGTNFTEENVKSTSDQEKVKT